jgi:DNA-binding transcriptional MerR regulator/methylmalonyl-CoA mutase cobalamin-binding subunit
LPVSDHLQSKPELMSIGEAVTTLRSRYPAITHSSLRFLEREGLVTSSRTEGGHRLYSPADLERVLLIKRWQEEGASLEVIQGRLDQLDSLPAPDQLSESFLRLAESHRTEEARQLIRDAERAGITPATIFFEVLQPALVAVGNHWQSGKLPVYEEKTISEICRELVTEISQRNSPDCPDGPLIIAACVEGERHELGLQMVYGLLRQRGYRVRYLGSNVETVFLTGAIAANQPDVVLLSSSTEHSFEGCLAAIRALGDLRKYGISPLIVVGGASVLPHADQLATVGAVPVADRNLLDRLAQLLPAPA